MARKGLLLAAIILTGYTVGPESVHAQALHPQWSPTAAWIAYYQRDGDSASVFIVRPDGSGRERITSGANYDANPTWGPGGHELAFARGVGGMRQTWDVFVRDVGSGRETRLTDTPEREMHTTWSPDGRRIAYIVLTEDGSDIHVMNRDGGGVRQLTFTDEREFHPKWSPDGRSLIYDSGDDNGRQVWTIDVDTGEARRLTRFEAGTTATAPAWDPEGARFTFALRHGNDSEGLFISDSEGENVQAIDTGGLSAGASYWSPDGSRVAFHAPEEGGVGGYGVFVMPVAGGEIVKVSE